MQQADNLRPFFADMHIHIGASRTGRPVKITGSRTLTLSNILYEAKNKKGMDIIGIIDCHAPEVLEELKEMKETGQLIEYEEGGLEVDGLTLIPGTEIEINDDNCQGPLHVLAYMPNLNKMEALSSWLSARMKNINLSSQRIYGDAKELQNVVRQLGGLFIPAHIFTPFKSLYGKGVKSSINEVLDPNLIDAVELGLSSNTEMASWLDELASYPFLSNSDAHSLEKIAREYQMIQLAQPTFKEFKRALEGKEGRGIIANYGLNPYLGKYYNSVCEECSHPFNYKNISTCLNCGGKKFIKGVHDRIQELKGNSEQISIDRPPYIHQIPLEFIPGIGPKTLLKLREAFGTDMDIIHAAPADQLQKIVKPSIAAYILSARSGEISIQIGGGGTYGKIVTDKPIN
ncbi:endonuclease Q family protein [Fictibacillus phosphorivorans]|uniref:endonuclease Q family protein n=1 Tax=Fictibacillus phosphorivorans TaxID=1221500 RepID=UPI002041CC94|nr:endonuclease Q family protein [Fictibacillus phosphorivorans]MCM3719679.1 endonuclease Q family protein [Fictibacillus phosphorivorans]MCM3777370.1 endonuclease Q family protein [Fictibacillus phosphorivorans]